MNNNTLGIVGIVAGSVVALAGIAGIALKPLAEPKWRVRTATTPPGPEESPAGIIVKANRGALTDDKWTEILGILNSDPVFSGVTRSELYRIREWKHGAAQPPQGNLLDVQLFGDVGKFKPPQNFDGYAFQIGVGVKENNQKFPEDIPNMPQGRGKVYILESQEMVDEVNKVLHR